MCTSGLNFLREEKFKYRKSSDLDKTPVSLIRGNLCATAISTISMIFRKFHPRCACYKCKVFLAGTWQLHVHV